VDTTLPQDLAESLVAAAVDRVNIHNDLCKIFDEGPDDACMCGVPQLLADLVDALGLRWLEALMIARGDILLPARQD
jgi:hypothetical protein